MARHITCKFVSIILSLSFSSTHSHYSLRTTVTTNLMTVIMLYITTVPITYRTMFTVPNIALMNIMACRVFRNTKFGFIRETTISTSKIGSQTERTAASVIPLSLRKGSNPSHTVLENTRSVGRGVEITKTVEQDYDGSSKEYTKNQSMV